MAGGPFDRAQDRRGRAWRRGKTFALSAEQMAAFVAAIEAGATVAQGAGEAGVAVSTAYHRRRIDPAFAEAWAAAAAASSGYPNAVPATGATHVRRSGGRKLVRARKRPVEFDRERKQAFLDHFARTCNLEASARAAGICVNSVYRALASDAAFAEGFEEALGIGYKLLEAEALGQQRAAQETYRIDPKAPEALQSFERTMRLLHEYKRGFGRIGRRPVEARLTKWSFDDAFAALEERLKAFRLRIERGEQPPED